MPFGTGSRLCYITLCQLSRRWHSVYRSDRSVMGRWQTGKAGRLGMTRSEEDVSRADEMGYVLQCVADAECCAIVGLSNTGKSALLRAVHPSAVSQFGPERADEFVFIYIDCNLMVEMTEQAFYELTLRSTLNVCSRHIPERLQSAYEKVVGSTNAFLIPLGFNEGLVVLCEELGKRVVFMFDEFDEPYKQIDQRVFLNLRALKDRYGPQLCYVVATGQRMSDMRQGSEIGEFGELFAHQTLYLGSLSYADAQHAVTRFMREEGVPSSECDVAFAWKETGGHPGLLEAVCHVLIALGGLNHAADEHLARETMDGDLTVRGECRKLWHGLTERQQLAVSDFARGKGVPRAQVRALSRIGILREDQGSQDIFGAVFERYVRSLHLAQGSAVPGVRIDVDAGEVWVDGRRTEALTDLEYRVLLLFADHGGQLCNKYQIVEAVWGEDYIDRVDDARIEKLISRLRKKIEPDPNNPQYLVTVRGRGYKLVGAVGRRNE